MSGGEMTQGSFAVVGTDTGVGKTVVTAGLVGWLRKLGRDARAVKPVQSGYPPDDDAAVVARACGTEAAATCPRRLEPALAPAVAADVADESLSYDAILEEARRLLAESQPGVLEGVGGLRVPLADGKEILDLVADLGLPAVVVARSGLGTLNHSALTVSALRSRGIDVNCVILNMYEGETLAAKTNPDVLAGMTDCPVFTLPPIDTDDESAIPAAVRAEIPSAVFPEGAVPDSSASN